ncbi:hypothetical protein BOX15_Mlig031117g1, partial [Macrostomum lignano]
ASGVKVQQEVLDTFQEIKTNHCYRYLLFGFVNNDKEIGVLKKAPADATYNEFIEDLKDSVNRKVGCYAVYDLVFEFEESKQKRSRLVFVSWGPDGIPIRQKMLIASSKVELKNKLQGIFKELQASGIDEASEECMLELCRQGDRGAN